jgi:glycosyltransferase involved in cell wall biosynthesis
MSDSRPYISVIIPTYNRSDFIVAAIESVLGQKNSKWSYEVIVVDDGSTDNTAEILKAYKNKVSYFKIKHSGLPAVARNFGISKARGELIAFQDSDDLWAEDKFALQVPVFDDPKVVLSYGQAKAMDDKGNKLGKKVVDPKKLKAGENFNTLIKENVISTLTTMVRRSALAEVGNFNEAESLRAVEDYELWMRIANAFPGSIHSLKNTLASYRVHSQNISSANALLSIERLLAVYGVLWEIQSLSDSIRQALEQQIDTMNENWSRQQNIDTPPPAISVVMGIYKDKAYVKQAIESILKQSFKEFEFIIIDDGSSDGSYEVAASFKDPRIRIIRQINHGLVNALNKGVHLARANLIARQDADDISLPI